MDFSPIQIAMVLIIALIVFGPKRLPELGRQLGRGLREAKRQMSEIGDEMTRAADTENVTTTGPAEITTTAGVATSTTSARTSDVTDAGDVDAATDDDLLDGVLITREANDDAASDEPTVVPAAEAAPHGDLLDGVVVSGDTPPGSPSQG